MPDKPTNYQAFMMRCWISTGDQPEGEAYRFSLEDPHTGERYSFGKMDAMVTFLRAQLAGRRVRDGTPPKPEPGEAEAGR